MQINIPIHLCIDSKIPSYFRGQKKICKRKIQEIMNEYEYDEDFIEGINEDFCKGFGTARDIIYEFLREEYYKQIATTNAQAAEVWEKGKKEDAE